MLDRTYVDASASETAFNRCGGVSTASFYTAFASTSGGSCATAGSNGMRRAHPGHHQAAGTRGHDTNRPTATNGGHRPIASASLAAGRVSAHRRKPFVPAISGGRGNGASGANGTNGSTSNSMANSPRAGYRNGSRGIELTGLLRLYRAAQGAASTSSSDDSDDGESEVDEEADEPMDSGCSDFSSSGDSDDDDTRSTLSCSTLATTSCRSSPSRAHKGGGKRRQRRRAAKNESHAGTAGKKTPSGGRRGSGAPSGTPYAPVAGLRTQSTTPVSPDGPNFASGNGGGGAGAFGSAGIPTSARSSVSRCGTVDRFPASAGCKGGEEADASAADEDEDDDEAEFFFVIDDEAPASEVMTVEQSKYGQGHPGLRLLPPPRFEPRLTVVLDLDETLIRMREGPVFVRPYAKLLFEMLRQIPDIEVVIWTCATKAYALRALSAVPSAHYDHIVARHKAWYKDGTPAVKNLRWLGRDMDRCIAIDNCPVAVSSNPDNCIVVQDIPECLPMADETLKRVCDVLSFVLESGKPVPEALGACPLMHAATFSVEEEDDDDDDDESVCIGVAMVDDDEVPTSSDAVQSPNAMMPTAFPETPMSPASGAAHYTGNRSNNHTTNSTAPRRSTSTLVEPAYFAAQALMYSIPGIVATYGAREHPQVREQLAAEKAAMHSSSRRRRQRRG